MTIQGFTSQLTWTGTNPAPYRVMPTQPTGSATGVMASTNTVYTEIYDVAALTRIDNIGLEISWTGTPSGTITVNGSNGGVNFYSLTFSPAITQPTGSPGGYLIDLNQYPFRFLMLQYANTSGSGAITAILSGRSL